MHHGINTNFTHVQEGATSQKGSSPRLPNEIIEACNCGLDSDYLVSLLPAFTLQHLWFPVLAVSLHTQYAV